MYSIVLSWKSFKVDLPSMEFWLKNSSVTGYAGNSADSAYTLWFASEPGNNIKAMVQQKWDSLSESGEAEKIALRLKRDQVVAYAKDNLAYISMNQWTPAEIKLFMSQPLTDADKDALIAKYPGI